MGGYVVPVTGPPIPAGTVLIRDGVIVAVGTDVTIPADVPVLDVSGRWVLPASSKPTRTSGSTSRSSPRWSR